MSETVWMCVDPGETTGFSIWDGKELRYPQQMALWQFIHWTDRWLTEGTPGVADFFQYGLDAAKLGALVVEDWALYPWELQNLAWDKCRTARGIGALELLAQQHHIPLYLQGADIKEAAQAAGAEALYLEPVDENRHANDSIQHGVFYLAINGLEPPC